MRGFGSVSFRCCGPLGPRRPLRCDASRNSSSSTSANVQVSSSCLDWRLQKTDLILAIGTHVYLLCVCKRALSTRLLQPGVGNAVLKAALTTGALSLAGDILAQSFAHHHGTVRALTLHALPDCAAHIHLAILRIQDIIAPDICSCSWSCITCRPGRFPLTDRCSSVRLNIWGQLRRAGAILSESVS